MPFTLHAVFDGQVLRPDEPQQLKPNARYKVTLEEDVDGSEAQADGDTHPLTALLALAEDLGVTDLAERHDFYAHGRR